MNRLPTSLFTPEQVRALDRRAIEQFGIPGATLMSRAGRAAWRLIRARYPQAQRLLVLCGGGNNGGDGYVIAQSAADAGVHVDLCPWVDPAQLTGDAATAAKSALSVIQSQAFTHTLIEQADVIVDALLGTGLDRAVEGAMADAIEACNASGKPIVAIDVPSGLSARTGQVLGVAMRSALTPSFIGLKQGLFTADAPDYVGEIAFDDLGVPAAVYEGVAPAARRIDEDALADALPMRARTAHKGNFGHVLVIGGDYGMGGAVRIAAEAAARAGAGLTSVATRPCHVPAVIAARPELMVQGVTEAADMAALIERASVLALGPGLGQEAWGEALFAAVMSSKQALVLDADGLNWLANAPQERGDWILTPHPGEAARMLQTDVAAVHADRFAAAQSLAQRYNAVVVLKGAGTIITDGQACQLCEQGNPGMASGGMGDALTGVIAGLRAQGFGAFEAACLGVQAHAIAADRAAIIGERGMLAGDLLDELRGVLNQ